MVSSFINPKSQNETTFKRLSAHDPSKHKGTMGTLFIAAYHRTVVILGSKGDQIGQKTEKKKKIKKTWLCHVRYPFIFAE